MLAGWTVEGCGFRGSHSGIDGTRHRFPSLDIRGRTESPSRNLPQHASAKSISSSPLKRMSRRCPRIPLEEYSSLPVTTPLACSPMT
jgi:hypothetical protein